MGCRTDARALDALKPSKPDRTAEYCAGALPNAPRCRRGLVRRDGDSSSLRWHHVGDLVNEGDRRFTTVDFNRIGGCSAARQELKMNRFALQLLAATTAALVLSTAQASGEDTAYNDDGGPVAYTFEENYPASDGPDLALMLDLPADYFGVVNFPPMSDYTLEDPPVMMAGLDPTETP